jgi:hypothetical protein
MTAIDRTPGSDSRRSSGRSTPTAQNQLQMTPTAFITIDKKNPLLGAAVSETLQNSQALSKYQKAYKILGGTWG